MIQTRNSQIPGVIGKFAVENEFLDAASRFLTTTTTNVKTVCMKMIVSSDVF